MSPLLLISTTNHLLALDEQERFYRVHSGKGLYYGLAQDNEHIFATCRNQIAGPDGDLIPSGRPESILVLSAQTLEPVDELWPTEFHLRDTHGMMLADGKLWVTSSAHNLIAVYDFKDRSWRKWYPSTNVASRDRDDNHFNTVALFDERLCLIAHNYLNPSFVAFHDRNSLDLCSAFEMGDQAHDVFPLGGGVGVCSSGEGLLIANTGWALRTGEFPRGLYFGPDSTLVGISQLAPREHRSKAAGILRRFTPDWRHLGDYLLHGSGNMLALMPLSVHQSVIDRLDRYCSVETFIGRFNTTAPGNTYRPGLPRPSMVSPLEWHGPEDTHRWTAARDASVRIVVNPGETRLEIQAANGFPGAYSLETLIEDQSLGSCIWDKPDEARFTVPLPPKLVGRCELHFRVPHLWRPIECLPNSQDARALGASILRVTVLT